MAKNSVHHAGAIFAILRICNAIILAAALAPGVCVGQTARPEENASAVFRSHPEGPFPNVDLPPQVIAPNGRFSLFADYANATKDGVPLYLVNRTDLPITIPGEDSELIVKLHGKAADGFWQRAQAYLGSACSTLRPSPTVSAGQHLKTLGYQPTGRTKGKIRYQLYLSSTYLISNVGDGLWSGDDVSASYSDRMAAVGQPIVEWLSDKNQGNNKPDPLQWWQNIGNTIAWLDLVSRWKTDGYFRYQVEMVREAIKALATPDSKETESALELVAEIGTRKSPPDAESDALRQACINSIKSPANLDLKPETTPNRPLVAWKALRWLIELETADQKLIPEEWKDTFTLMEAKFAAAEKAEKEAMCGLFVSPRLVSEHVKTSFFLENVHSELSSISGMCINYLAGRQAYGQLAEIGLAGDVDLKMRILADFSLSPDYKESPYPRFRVANDPIQQKFWESCLTADPWRSYYEMNSKLGVGYDNRIDLGPWLSDVFRVEFKRLMTNAEHGIYPVTGLDQRCGIRYYVKTLLVDMKFDSFTLLRRAVSLIEKSPTNEPAINFEARCDLVKAAGRELAIEQYFH